MNGEYFQSETRRFRCAWPVEIEFLHTQWTNYDLWPILHRPRNSQPRNICTQNLCDACKQELGQFWTYRFVENDTDSDCCSSPSAIGRSDLRLRSSVTRRQPPWPSNHFFQVQEPVLR